jgi:aldose sugar dehydrogenase
LKLLAKYRQTLKVIAIASLIALTFAAGYKSKSSGLFPISKWISHTKPKVKTTEKQYIGNDFLLNLKPYAKNFPVEKSAGLVEENNGVITVFEQADALSIWTKYHLDDIILDAKPTPDYKGGLKRIFSHNGDLIGLFAMKSNSENCYFGEIINLSRKIEVLKAPCIPNIEYLDFNALGGGHVSLNNGLLIALGTPTTDDDEISILAQDRKSPYGKVLIFSNSDLLSTKKKEFRNFSIYSSGHRNPQGMTKIGPFIYAVEHGPKGGDEVNLIEQGKNYGWPLYSMGSKYAGPAYHAISSDNQFTSPIYSFIPSIGISNISSCPANLSQRYKPLLCMLVSSLRAESIFIILLDPKTQKVLSSEQVKIGMRLREFFQIKSNEIFIATDASLYELIFDQIEPFSKSIQK